MRRIYQLIIFSIILTGGSGILFGQNYKIRQSTSISGQNISSTIYVKGSRKRTETSGMMGMGADVATIEQCDLKRTVQVNDKKKLYFIEPFTEESMAEVPQAPARPIDRPDRVTRGGTITMTTSINDTGERKQMFGLTARHIKTSMTMQSSPDACSKNDMSMETDGWYVDLPQFSCPVNAPRNPMAQSRQPRSGCQDRIVTKFSGGGKLGFPLMVTTTMNSGGETGYSQSIETLEFSRETLGDALFAVPSTYTLAASSQELYDRPDISTMIQGSQNRKDDRPQGISQNNDVNTRMQNQFPQTKRPGVIRIGVLPPTNRSGESVSVANLQKYLSQRLTVGNTEGIAINSEADARAAGCDFTLSSDLSKLKQTTTSKIGGLFGKVTNTSGPKNYDAQVDFKLLSLKTGQSVLQNKAAARIDGDADRAAEGILAQEAIAVLAAAR